MSQLWDAPNYFDPVFGATTLTQLVRRADARPGADKTFLSADYEGFRQHLHRTGVDLIPDTTARRDSLPRKVVSPTAGISGTSTRYRSTPLPGVEVPGRRNLRNL